MHFLLHFTHPCGAALDETGKLNVVVFVLSKTLDQCYL